MSFIYLSTYSLVHVVFQWHLPISMFFSFVCLIRKNRVFILFFWFLRLQLRIQRQPWEHVNTHLPWLMEGEQTAILHLLVPRRRVHQLLNMVSHLSHFFFPFLFYFLYFFVEKMTYRQLMETSNINFLAKVNDH